MRTLTSLLTPLALSMLAACGPSAPAKAPEAEGVFHFDYASADGQHAVRTVRQSREISVVGAPFRAQEATEVEWEVDVHKEPKGRVLLQQQVSRFRAEHNGAPLVDTRKIPGPAVVVDTHLDENGQIVEMTGTDRVARALVSMAAPESQAAAAQLITEDGIKQIFAGRFDLVVRDVVGKPSAVGSKWDGQATDELLVGRHLEVLKHEPCGNDTCARVKATYDVNPRYAMVTAANLIADFAMQNGIDPRGVVVKNVKATVSDTMLLVPATMAFHGGDFVEELSMTIVGPQREWDLVVKGARTVTVKYAQ